MTRIEKLRVFGEWLIAFLKQPLKSYFHFKYYKQRKHDRAVENGTTLKLITSNQTKRETRCNHLKGGDGVHAVVSGTGVSDQYAVIKHTFANGDTWVNCLRCGKKWKPGTEGYAEALAFRTRNITSGAVRFWAHDAKANEEFIRKHRELTKNS